MEEEFIEFCKSIGFICNGWIFWYEPIKGKLIVNGKCKVIDVYNGFYYPDNLAKTRIKFNTIKEVEYLVFQYKQLYIWNVKDHS